MSLVATIFMPPPVIVTEAAEKARGEAIFEASNMVALSNYTEFEGAVAAMKQLKSLIKEMEESRKAIKAPVLEFGKAVDEAAKRFAGALEAEYSRLQGLVAEFQTKQNEEQVRAMEEARRAAEAENARRAEERRQEADTPFGAPLDIPPPAPVFVAEIPITMPRVRGMVNKEEITLEVTDIMAIYHARPDLVEVKYELRSKLAKELVKSGGLIECPGLLIKKANAVTVRT